MLRLLRFLYRMYYRLLVGCGTLTGWFKLRVLGRAAVGSGVRIRGPIRVKVFPGGRLIVADGVRLQSGFRHNPVGNECVTGFWVGSGGRLEIRAGAGLSGATVVCLESVVIGENAFIGGGTRIYDTDFHPVDPDVRRERPQEVPTAPVRIGAECFIGGYSIILKGVTIGDRSVVGAGSVVAKSIPPGEIWAGNPARRIRGLAEEHAPKLEGESV